MQFAKPSGRHGWILALALCAAGMAPAAQALEITLPPETARYTPSDLPGYRLVQQNCMTCHSAQYVLTQPPSSPRSYWDATVRKMKKPFGAPFADEDIPAMVDYLTKTYGAERTAYAAAPAVQAAPATIAGGSHDPQTLLTANGCTACHAVDKKVVGPAFKEVAAKYANQPGAAALVAQNIRAGGAGKWGQVPMPGYAALSSEDLQSLAGWILGR
ncbi:cytochrome C552 [Cupriavidus sp. CV2]|uniref:SorB family sulfite dehydrogenase c-type cytochrome subunit n=1 Tax=Cupriavidus ulmosensis TaxID=3065913 RepID=UPI00296B0219|nr:c-type cytochrome [Cupriavidus sp. CV2]MDW3687743.1 cytochrome C552 [Cupriavidus sp. CV2]